MQLCVCVFVFVCVSLKRGFGRGTISPCNFKSPLSSRSLVLSRSRFHYACVVLLVCFCGGCDFILAIAQLLFCFFLFVVGVAELFFILIISYFALLFCFLLCCCCCSCGFDSRDVIISNGRGISFYQQQCCS